MRTEILLCFRLNYSTHIIITQVFHFVNSFFNIFSFASDKRYMQALFDSVHSRLEKDGVDFWRVDRQQDYLFPHIKGIPTFKHLPWLNYLYYNHMKRDGNRGISFSRWGGFEDRKHPIYFSGDTKSIGKSLPLRCGLALHRATPYAFTGVSARADFSATVIRKAFTTDTVHRIFYQSMCSFTERPPGQSSVYVG